MKYSILFLWRPTLILKVVLILTVIWLMAAMFSTKSRSRNTIIVEYDYGETEPLKMATLRSVIQKTSTYANDISVKPTRVDWLGRLAGKEGFVIAAGSNNAPGELGKPVVLPKNLTMETEHAVAEGWRKNAYNQYVSDLISIRRKLPDPRDEWCKVPGRYLEDLPQTSVVICFHNEAWSALLRTVHSVLDRTPAHLIKEIILVDDYSDMPHLMQQLDDYMSSLPKVRIVRATRREGLIRARLLGARYVTAPVLTYLDSHCECTEGWLEPLLDRIARNKTTVVCPVIDVIDDNTFEYHHQLSAVNVGGFSWNLQFSWHTIPLKERARHKHTAEPVWSPTMAGGLFAIDKDFFERMGTYDSGFDIWGGENLELSFKTWMCGGTLEIVPCSHVGHIFRKRSPYNWVPGVNVLKKNSVRLAEVWLDDYAKYYYERVNNDKGFYGDITGRKELRKKLGCKSFEWYLKNIYPELFIPGESVAHGEFKIILNNVSYCLDGVSVNEHELDEEMLPVVKIRRCHHTGGKQYWMYSKDGEIRRDDTCLDYSSQIDVVLYSCHGSKGNQLWLYNDRTKLLKHSPTKKCMAISRNRNRIIMETCNESDARQMWNLENFKPERLTPDLTHV